MAAATYLAVLGNFSYTNNNGAITITGYTGPGGSVTIPGTIDGLPVTSVGAGAFAYGTNLTAATIGNTVTNIGSYAFAYCTNLTSITIGNGVTGVGDGAFYNCTNLTTILFQGNAPGLGSGVFDDDNDARVYYLPGTTGWSATFGGCPTVPWETGLPATTGP
jgi:hypothetical protein